MNDCITLNLNLPDVVVLGQQHAATGLVIEVAYHAQAARCPHCGRRTTKVHERRAQRKRDVPLRGETVTLLLWRRRFRCLWCRAPRGRARTFSEPDPVCVGVVHTDEGAAARLVCVSSLAANHPIKR